MSLSIGQLNLQLVGDARGLQKMLPDMNRLGKAINTLSKKQEAGSSKAVTALNRQEQAIRRQLNAVQNLNAQISRTGGPSNLLGSNTRAMQSFTKEMSKGTLSTAQFNRANDKLTATLARSGRSLRAFNSKVQSEKVSKLGQTMRNLESASVLAVGPLSGLGARIQAIGAIAGRSALLVALFFGAITLGIVILSKLAVGAVEAAKAMEKINARLTVATGSSTKANSAFEFVSATARRMGLEVLTSADAFSQLAAATRGTAAEGKITRKVFEGIAAASAALRLSTDQVQGAFRAVQQIASKGRVQSEELIGQLAERIPNAIQIAADAFGTNQAALLEMVQNGLVPATDFLDKFGRQLTKVFGRDAEKNLDSIAGKTNALSNAMLDFSQELEAVIGVSELWKDILDLTTKAVIGWTRALKPAVKFLKLFGEELTKTSFAANPAMWVVLNKNIAQTGKVLDDTTNKAGKAKDELTELQRKTITTLAGKLGKTNTKIAALVGGLGLVTPEARNAAAAVRLFATKTEEVAPAIIKVVQELDMAQRKFNNFAAISSIMDEVATPIEKVTARIAELQQTANIRRLRFFDGDTAGFDAQMAAIEQLKDQLETLGSTTAAEALQELNFKTATLLKLTPGASGASDTFARSLLQFADTTFIAADGTRQLNQAGRQFVSMFENADLKNTELAEIGKLMQSTLTPIEKVQKALDNLTNLKARIAIEFPKGSPEFLAAMKAMGVEGQRLKDLALKDELKFLDAAELKGTIGLDKYRQGIEQIDAAAALAQFRFSKGLMSPEALDRTLIGLELMKGELSKMSDTSKQMGAALTQGFEDAIFSGKKLGDVLKALIIDLIKIALRAAILKPLGNALGAGLGSFLGFAKGGKTPSNSSFLVGEKGPELLSFGKSGTVTPNDQLQRASRGGGSSGGGASNITQHITFTTTIKDDVRAIIVESLPAIASATTQALVDETQRSGIIKTFG